MRNFLARMVLLAILVILVLLGIVAIQHPQTWQKDWQAVRHFSLHKWQELRATIGWGAETTTPTSPSSSPSIATVTTDRNQSEQKVRPWSQQEAPSYPLPKENKTPESLSTSQQILLMAARQAFWQGDYPVAVADYRALIDAVPNSPALYGEMGNVLWRAGQGVAAGHAFAQAANLLLQEQQYQRAAALIPILSRLDPSAAQKIQMDLSR